MRHRYYDPGLGRWVTRDPIGYEGGKGSLYTALDSRPTAAVDPTGLICNEINDLICSIKIPLIQLDAWEDWRSHEPLQGKENSNPTGHDAMKHCYISCLVHNLAPSCDRDLDDREDSAKPGGRQDQDNNKDGRTINAGRDTKSDCWKGCLAKWRAGELSCSSKMNGKVLPFPCQGPPDDFPENWVDTDLSDDPVPIGEGANPGAGW